MVNFYPTGEDTPLTKVTVPRKLNGSTTDYTEVAHQGIPFSLKDNKSYKNSVSKAF